MRLGVITFYWKTPKHAGREQDEMKVRNYYSNFYSLAQRRISRLQDPSRALTLFSAHCTLSPLRKLYFLGAPTGLISFKIPIVRSIFFPENLVEVLCSLAQAAIGSPFAALSPNTRSPLGDEGTRSQGGDEVGTGGRWHTVGHSQPPPVPRTRLRLLPERNGSGSSISPCPRLKATLCKKGGGRAPHRCPGAALAAQLGT